MKNSTKANSTIKPTTDALRASLLAKRLPKPTPEDRAKFDRMVDAICKGIDAENKELGLDRRQ